jgi:Mn-dependent DtxR family transcriptional regulator
MRRGKSPGTIVKELGLSRADVAALKGYAGMLKRHAPLERHNRLAQLGLIVERAGGWMLTPKGRTASRYRGG